jgi:hypothetical protein
MRANAKRCVLSEDCEEGHARHCLVRGDVHDEPLRGSVEKQELIEMISIKP